METLNMYGTLKAGTFPDGIACRHKSKPAEPFAREHEHGLILRITPSSGINPAQGFVDWGGYTTWEKLDSLEISYLRDRRDE